MSFREIMPFPCKRIIYADIKGPTCEFLIHFRPSHYLFFIFVKTQELNSVETKLKIYVF